MNEGTVRVGTPKPGTIRCRLFGHKLRRAQAIVRVRMNGGIGLNQVWSESKQVSVCRRCGRLDTQLTVPALPGDTLESVTVELEEAP